MGLYINGIAGITPQPSFDGSFPEKLFLHSGPWLHCLEPEYKGYLNPILARRMSRIIKMGVTTAKKCLTDALIEQPDAIIAGTGLGCMEDTEKFLASMIDNKEKLLPPASFIQSTHNTIAAQIALELKNNNYNLTYVHRGFSFENVLTDCTLLANENPGINILAGGIDEIIPSYHTITRRMGLWKENVQGHIDLKNSVSKGGFAGEGAIFFALSGKAGNKTYANITGTRQIFRPASMEAIVNKITEFLEPGITPARFPDAVMMGFNGDLKGDKIYKTVAGKLFSDKLILTYKNFCGDYFTSTSFALYLAAKILAEKKVPAPAVFHGDAATPVNSILIYNHFNNINHSLILLKGC